LPDFDERFLAKATPSFDGARSEMGATSAKAAKVMLMRAVILIVSPPRTDVHDPLTIGAVVGHPVAEGRGR
jgi:hypothetical protein